MSNESSSDKPRLRPNKSDSCRNKSDSDEESVEALLQLRHQRPRHVNKSRPSQVPKHSITRASIRKSVGYNILQLK